MEHDLYKDRIDKGTDREKNDTMTNNNEKQSWKKGDTKGSNLNFNLFRSIERGSGEEGKNGSWKIGFCLFPQFSATFYSDE